MRVLILGTLLRPTAFTYNQAANPASTKWLSGFARGLAKSRVPVSLCGHCYAQVWPKGPLMPGNEAYLEDRYPNHLVRFVNLPGMRFKSLASGYARVAQKVLERGSFDAVLTYNPYPWHVAAARKLRDRFNIPWICLNLDFDDVGENWERFVRDAGDADGHLFLSHWGYENAPVERKIHLDSGVVSIPEDFGSKPQGDTFTITYLGKLSKSGGLEALLQLPKSIDAPNVRFVYGGKGYPEADQKLKALAARDSRVSYLGFVEEADVSRFFEEADVFLNPRDPDDVINDMVFPSKIMQYLQRGKTVVSTWTRGLEPVYRDLMVFAENASLDAFVQAVEVAIAETDSVREERSEIILKFLESSRLWSKQGQRFTEFAEGVIGDFHERRGKQR